MKSAPFDYHRPVSIAEAVALLQRFENAKLLAGGQSLVPMLNMRYAAPGHIIDVSNLESLRKIDVQDEKIVIGAAVPQAELLAHEELGKALPILGAALDHVGHIQTRSRGTIGGSLCHLDPSAELPLVALLCDAVLHVSGPSGTRSIAMSDWPLAYMMPAIEPDEILVEIEMPAPAHTHGWGFEEFARRRGDFAIVSAAALVQLEGDRIARIALGLGGVSHRPLRLSELEAELMGQAFALERLDEVAEAVRQISAMGDAYYSSEYRAHLAATLIKRAFSKALAGAGGRI